MQIIFLLEGHTVKTHRYVRFQRTDEFWRNRETYGQAHGLVLARVSPHALKHTTIYVKPRIFQILDRDDQF